MKSVMPAGVVLYAGMDRGGSPLGAGVKFGTLIGVFAVCAFVIHNCVNLNIGLRLTIGQAVAHFVEWLVVGIVIAAVYRPVTTG
ncbi:MAG TPA: hypothetical protein VH087_03100 [Thermoanaerobaculia bacterium]|jgi:uncharacterized membrane protein|nr:hypothetical protein [Thermoanaerobaculia bacterium]